MHRILVLFQFKIEAGLLLTSNMNYMLFLCIIE